MKELVVIAQPEEISLVEQLGYENYPILITGVGAINVINSLKNVNKDTHIINIGYCGGSNINKGTVVQIKNVNTETEIADFNEDSIKLKVDYDKPYQYVRCFTSTDFVTKTEKQFIQCVFDMELAFIASMFENTTAFKIVSDNLNYEEYKETVND